MQICGSWPWLNSEESVLYITLHGLFHLFIKTEHYPSFVPYCAPKVAFSENTSIGKYAFVCVCNT